ncbi:MAG: 1-hydroxy-2-methyl-2-(E)-butenyl 4-diphosphate synthase, partial [Flammeovirgaceae bacterium]|nr:1-hydroxy-2-methyl-2-(E)-butenyl 4-diphosphate synthase [Flammeovirgaceae bacterium]
SEFNFSNKLINSSISIGGLFVDGLGDGIFIKNNNEDEIKIINELSFNILQATRTRISKTEFISCPSCGRTQFDLQKTTDKVRKRTGHLKGLKIAVMGCIVNGPGEMADADYGYVGTGRNKISLYKGHNLIKSHIDSKDSITELINLIKNNNDWIEPN